MNMGNRPRLTVLILALLEFWCSWCVPLTCQKFRATLADSTGAFT
jgi:hypothetical protein